MVRRMDLNHARTRIFKAVLHKNAKFVRMFIDLGAKVNVKDDFGLTPLDYAKNSYDISRELEKHGAVSTTQKRPLPIQIPESWV
jgi:ankyrin repeat protein